MIGPFFEISCSEEILDEPQKSVVVDLFSQYVHQDAVVHSVEKLRNISLHKPFRAGPGRFHLRECGVATSIRPEPMRMVAHLRLVISFKDEPKHLLEEFIRPGGHIHSTLPLLPKDLRNG